jgi:hypothetical protein
MNINTLYQIFARALFFIALAALCLAFIEHFANLFGSSVFNNAYTPGRMVELSAALLLFVITVLLRQIRDVLKKSDSS